MRFHRVLILLVVVALLSTSLPPTVYAQDNRTIVSLAIPRFFENFFNEQLITDFETQNPTLKIQLVTDDAAGFSSPAAGQLDEYFTGIEKYANSADVLYVSSNVLIPEGTQAGYFLDLKPLIAEDTTLDAEDFYPAVWQSFQWDGGMWAIPFGTDLFVLTYDPQAFDQASLAYPNEAWTLDDLLSAARALTVKDDAGKVTRAGLDYLGEVAYAYLFRSLLGRNAYDNAMVPAQPKFSGDADIENILTQWLEVEREGSITRGFNTAPINISSAFVLALPAIDNNPQRVGALLPGGFAGVDPSAFAISAGTQHPEAAYTLAKFLSFRSEFASSGFVPLPARRSLVGTKSDNAGITLNIPADVQDFMLQAIERAVSLSDIRFMDYLGAGYAQMRDANVDTATALKDAETAALDNQQKSLDKKGTYTLNVTNVLPATTADDGRGILKFNFASILGGENDPNKDKWDALLTEFTASDPQIGKVDLKAGFESLQDATAKYDCFYLPFNLVPNAQLDTLLPFNPYLDADPTFAKDDVVGNILTQLSRENQIWAYPIMIEPSSLVYDATAFQKSGVPNPAISWTVDEFNDALKNLKITPEDPAPFKDSGTMGNYIFLLIASYGGLPLDFRTDPPTIAYTTPDNVEATRQVLDLAKNGYIEYQALGNLFNMGSLFANNAAVTPAITTSALNIFRFAAGGTNEADRSNERFVSYPRGNKFNAVSYNIGTAYISAKSQYPDACYRFIQKLAARSDLFEAMPARASMVNDPALASLQSESVVALYKDYLSLMQDPNTINLPSIFSGGESPTGFLLEYWLFKAWDAYVLNDADLEVELGNAEAKAVAFQQCVKDLPPLDNSSPETQRAYIKAYGDCATKIDESLKPIFALISG